MFSFLANFKSRPRFEMEVTEVEKIPEGPLGVRTSSSGSGARPSGMSRRTLALSRSVGLTFVPADLAVHHVGYGIHGLLNGGALTLGPQSLAFCHQRQ